MRMSVRSKILATLMPIVVLMVSHRLISTHVLRTIERRASSAMARHFEVRSLVSQLLCQTQMVHNSALFQVSATSQDAMARHESEMKQAIAQARALLQRFSEACQTPAELEQVVAFHTAWNAYTAILIEQLVPADRATAERLLLDNGAAGVAAREASSRLNALEQATRAAARDALTQMDHERWQARLVLLGMMLAAAAISLVFAMYTSSRIGSAINSVRNAARLVAEGDLEWSVAVKTRDEIETIAESLTKVARRTRQSLATSRETTEQLQRQIQECRRLQTLLKTKDNRLRAVIGMLEQAVIVTDAEGKIMLLSQAAAGLTGWRCEQALGEPVGAVLHLLDETTGAPRPSPADEALQNQRRVRHSKRATLLDKEGAEHRIILDSAPVLDGDNQIAGTAILFREEVEET